MGSSDANVQQSLALEEMVSSCRSGVVVHNCINGSDDHQKRSSSSSVILQMQQNIIKRGPHHHDQADQVIDQVPHDHHHQVQVQAPLKCPRCESRNTKFCYYNNYSLSQPRYFCKSCRRYWTKGGSLRNVPVGGGCRKNKHKTTTSINSNYININKIIKQSTQLPYHHQQQHQLGAVLSPPPADPDHLVGIVVLQPPPPSCFIPSSNSSSSPAAVLLNSSYNDQINDQYSMMMLTSPHAQQQQLTHDLLGMNTIIRPNHNQTGRKLRDIDQINAAGHVADIDDQIQILDGTTTTTTATTTTRRNNIIFAAAGGFPIRMDLSLFGLSANSSSVHDDPDHHQHPADHMRQIGRSTINHEDQQVSNVGRENINGAGDHHQLIMGNIGTLVMENNNGGFRGTTSSDDDDSMMNRTKDLDAGTAAGRMWGAHDDHDEWGISGGGGESSGKDQLAGNKQDQYYWNTMGPWHAMLNSYAAAGPSSLTPLM